MNDENKLSSIELGVLIIDALVDAGVINPADSDRAAEVVAEEIDVRKAAGDY
jgi:hypothetical protein